MRLTYVPLLNLQRDLYRLPPGPDRFQTYLRTLVDASRGDITLPLMAMNPMAKAHVPAFLDELIEMDGDAIAATATAAAAAQLTDDPGDYQVTLVVCDDLQGGWTNRYTTDFDYRFRQRPYYQRGWLATILWVSEMYDPDQIQAEVLCCIYRAIYIQRHGYAQTLRDCIAQETYAMGQAMTTTTTLAVDDLHYTRQVLADLWDRTDTATLLAALYGDEAAHELGHPPLGLSAHAGLALAQAR
ncbi:hypothetical protein IQ254_06405 [Nodosilinea sp. LEGE 07088]|uniref:hypothetical protein n=1 Tax=Nodosilinea sp. LEGE 07088 TaxID=2777968 RepID=UPI00187FFA37|nr:hypothetical protein [Nodosilinea sp. LEGE 07088]MBE9136839.1 hypothetical protein [Nodosilinea sp. LEGE 07088]